MSRSSMGERLSYANVMATVAVFIALGGSSYAAVKVTGKHVKNETLTGADVKNNSLSGTDIRQARSPAGTRPTCSPARAGLRATTGPICRTATGGRR